MSYTKKQLTDAGCTQISNDLFYRGEKRKVLVAKVHGDVVYMTEEGLLALAFLSEERPKRGGKRADKLGKAALVETSAETPADAAESTDALTLNDELLAGVESLGAD